MSGAVVGDIETVTLTSSVLTVRLISLGAAIAGVEAPDAHGGRGGIHLGLGSVLEYRDRAANPHLGASIGRYANRIAGAAFDLDGTTWHLEANDGPNTLHGGSDGWDRRVWDLLEEVQGPDGGTAVFRIDSPAGDGGFPGEVQATATYDLDGDRLRIAYAATTDAPTVLNMTNHGYWNLSGIGSTVAGHRLAVAAERYLPVDGAGIPTGALEPVEGTRFDLRAPTVLGSVLDAGGLDHCYEVRGATGELRATAVLASAASGRWMSVHSDQVGVQVYTGNGLHDPFVRHGSVSLETQMFPDTPNRPELGSARLDPGGRYESLTELRFGTGEPPPL